MGSWCRGMPRHQLTDHDPIEFPDLALHNRFACAPADPRDVHHPLAAHENVEAEMVWREERTVTASLALHYNKAMFILEPTPLTRSLARKRVHVCE